VRRWEPRQADKGDRGGACRGGAAWATRGGREEQVARGGMAAGASELTVVRSPLQRLRARVQGTNGRWPGCSGGLGLVL
jgi:hypothetical protein